MESWKEAKRHVLYRENLVNQCLSSSATLKELRKFRCWQQWFIEAIFKDHNRPILKRLMLFSTTRLCCTDRQNQGLPPAANTSSESISGSACYNTLCIKPERLMFLSPRLDTSSMRSVLHCEMMLRSHQSHSSFPALEYASAAVMRTANLS
jgi:hypothetical protein